MDHWKPKGSAERLLLGIVLGSDRSSLTLVWDLFDTNGLVVVLI